MKLNIRSEQGFSLLELLASLVIFVIVITAFMGFFYQSSMFTKKNEDDLVAMNLAREVLEVIKEKELEAKPDFTFPTADFPKECDQSFDPAKIVEKDALGLQTDGTFDGSLYPCLHFKSEIEGDEYDTFLVTIEIYKKGQESNPSQLLTKTYGYVREFK